MHKKQWQRMVILAAAAAAVATQYRRWKQKRLNWLEAHGNVVETRCGLMEYGRFGKGPAVLISHGAPGGYDQGALLDELAADGFTVLTPSRPGYLRTPLHTGRSPAAQADAFAALLDKLGIDKVAVIGMSAGGPAALQFALRYPERVQALVMESAVSQAYRPPEGANSSALGRLFLSGAALDGVMWLLNRATHWFTLPILKSYMQLESTFSPAELERRAQQIVARPLQKKRFLALADSLTPYSLRKPGLDNDLTQLERLPNYPLEQISAPTLVLHSPHDNDVPLAHAKFVAETVPQADLVTVDAGGHFIWLTDEAEIAANRRREFLRQHCG